MSTPARVILRVCARVCACVRHCVEWAECVDGSPEMVEISVGVVFYGLVNLVQGVPLQCLKIH